MLPSDGKKKSMRSRLPTREELALWRQVVADVIPRAGRMAPMDQLPAVAAPQTPMQAPAAPMAFAPPPPDAPVRRAKLPPLAPIEKKLRRRLASGREAIDERLDLHGMTQAQAHHALSAFIQGAAARGARVVLVITGKGGPGATAQEFSERGVLRRATPLWLGEPSLRPLVLSVEEAARPHGGGGAFYVRLRRKRQG